MSDRQVTYDPALVQWMRENVEQTTLTKPELIVIFAEADRGADAELLHESLSVTQKEHILSIVEQVKAETITAAKLDTEVL